MHAHLVLVTKHRNPVFTDAHLLVRFPPKVATSKLVTSLKGVSSRMLRKEFEDLRFAHWKGARLRSGSYFAGSVEGAPISAVRQPIEQQTRPGA